MKRSRFNVLGLLLLVLMLLVVAGCKKACEHVDANDDRRCDECGERVDPKITISDLNYEAGTHLNLAVVHNSTKTTITFQDSSVFGKNQSSITLADGKAYEVGDFKPVWAELQNRLSMSFTDVYKGQTSVEKEYSAWKELGFEGVDVLVGNASGMAEDGRNGAHVDLSKYLQLMPNYSKFLEENPIVQLSVLADTELGTSYFAPYFDGFDDIEKYYLMRVDWIQALLDGEGQYSASTSDAFGKATAYTPYMPTSGKIEIESLTKDGSQTQIITKNYDTQYGNIIDYMNKNVTASTTGVELVNMLRGYIDAAYDGYYGVERSRLFAGYDACWDADELVALLRCVVTNTHKLTGQNEQKVSGLFPRANTLDRESDLVRATQMFGVRGTESRNGYLYLNKDGVVCDARGDEAFIAAVDKLNQLYKEGLILQDYHSVSNITELMYNQNLGFMIYDYSQTQSAFNDTVSAELQAAGFNLTACMTPVAKWDDGTGARYMRFTESWRSVKTSGWCIPAHVEQDENKLKAALKLFDYMYSEEGNVLMSFGPSAWIDGTTTYKGQEVPKMSAAALNELKTLAKGNYTNYARNYLGSTLPVGFVKNQAMEYQCTTEKGKTGALIVSQAIAKGTVKHVSPFIEENLWYTMIPTVLPTTAEQDSTIASFKPIAAKGLYSTTKGNYSIFQDIIVYGLGSGQALSNEIKTMPANAKELADYFVSDVCGGKVYKTYQQMAWDALLEYYNSL